MIKWLLAGITTLLLAQALAESSPYAGQQDRRIKSLSPAEIEALRAGQGMGFALAAELNRYPGPRHVLELAEELDLTEEQFEATERLFAAMQTEAMTLGEKLVAAEAELDAAFANSTIDAGSLEQALEAIAEIRAQLRFVHLETHLHQRELLTTEQIARYVSLRGYDQAEHDHSRHAGNH